MVSDRAKRSARIQALVQDRSSWVSHWRDLSEHQQPRLGRFLASDLNKGTRRHQNVLDNTALFAHRTLSAGLMAGMTSPARPWFRLGIKDRALAERGAVKLWLDERAKLILDILAAGNSYRALHSCYDEVGLFGTWADIVLDDFDNVIHHYPLTVGEYSLGVDAKGRVDTLAREFKMTVSQLVERFGYNRCSPTVRNLYDKGTYTALVDVCYLLEPNRDRKPVMLDASGKRWTSCYFEPARDAAEDMYLSKSGFDKFPALAPRWDVKSGDTYGSSPGMECQGDVRQLQHQQLRKGQVIDYQTNPPLQAPTSLKGRSMNRLPGGIEYFDATGPGAGIRTMFEVNLNMQHLLEDIMDVRDRIRRAYHEDLFLMLANDRRSNVTATEIAERHEEKLLMLGPVLERLHEELLSPLVERIFDRTMEARLGTPPPPELEGAEIDIQFVSVLAQAQRAVGAASQDRLIGTIGQLVGIWPEVRHKIDAFQVVDSYADQLGVDPKIIVPDDQAMARADAEAKQAAAAQAAAAAPGMAQAAKNTSEIDAENMANVMSGLTGYVTPQPGSVAA